MTSRKNSGAMRSCMSTVGIHDQLAVRQPKRCLREHLWSPEVVLRTADHQCLGLDIAEPIANVEGVLSAQHGDRVCWILDRDPLGKRRDRSEQGSNPRRAEPALHPVQDGLGRVSTGLLDCMQHFQLRALGKRTERVRGAGNHRLAHHIGTIRDQLKGQRSAGAVTQHVHRAPEVVDELPRHAARRPRRTWSRRPFRPAVGEIDLEAGTGQRVHRSQGERSLQARPRVSVVGGESAEIDQRLARTQREVRYPAAESSLLYLDLGHGLILLRDI